MKWVLRILGGLLALAIVAAGGLYLWLESSLPQISGRMTVAGLSAPVEIMRDEHGVPRIFAANEPDAFYALGFVHAQDRLFQMDATRLFAQGRLSEFFGPATLDQDRFMRALDLVDQADATLAALDPQWRRILDAYAAGVNAFLAHHTGALPPEFLLLRRTPEPWQPRDSLLWGKLMSLQLSGNWRDELTRAQLATRLSPDMLEQLWPEWPQDRATTLALSALYRKLDLDRFARAVPPPFGPSRASNEWVLSGAHTRSGKPMLVNDPHLGLGAPGQWYLARLEAPGLTLAGATAPGVPAMILGHNGQIAWGFTTTGADTYDLFIEQLDPTDPGRYLTPDGPRPFATRTETIKVKGQADVTVTLRATRHGPVISDVLHSVGAATPDQHVMALAMPSAHVTDRTPAALFALNRARNWEQFVAALRDWQGPMQNIVYADRDGHIGFYSPALLPRRKAGQGWMPQPGWTGAYDWDGFVPFEKLPHAFDPPDGRFVNANNRIVPNDYPVFIGRDWDAPYRALRILDLLNATPRQDRDTAASMLRDSVSLFARDLLPRLLAVKLTDPRAQQAAAMLRDWDGTMDRNRPQPLIFHAWMRALIIGATAEILGPQFGSVFRENPVLLRAVLDGTSPFCANGAGTADQGCTGQIVAALDRALDSLSKKYGPDMERWRWSDTHYAPFRHVLFSRVPVLRDLFGFHVPTDGDFFTVNRGAYRISDPDEPFAHVHGQTLRAIYDLAELDASLFIITPGQSGNPLSAHWGDLTEPWANGRQFPLRGDRARLQSQESVLILTPN